MKNRKIINQLESWGEIANDLLGGSDVYVIDFKSEQITEARYESVQVLLDMLSRDDTIFITVIKLEDKYGPLE